MIIQENIYIQPNKDISCELKLYTFCFKYTTNILEYFTGANEEEKQSDFCLICIITWLHSHVYKQSKQI